MKLKKLFNVLDCYIPCVVQFPDMSEVAYRAQLDPGDLDRKVIRVFFELRRRDTMYCVILVD